MLILFTMHFHDILYPAGIKSNAHTTLLQVMGALLCLFAFPAGSSAFGITLFPATSTVDLVAVKPWTRISGPSYPSTSIFFTMEVSSLRMYTARVNHPISIRKPRFTPNSGPSTAESTYVYIEEWRNRPLQGGRYPYVYVDGIYLRRNWGGEYENVAILVAIAVDEDGYREVLGAAEGMKEDKAS